MADEFDPSKLDRVISKMAELQLSLSELVRESVKNDVRNKTEIREDLDTTDAAIKVTEEVLEAGKSTPQEKASEVEIQEFRFPDVQSTAPSTVDVRASESQTPEREQVPLTEFTPPAFETTLPPQELQGQTRVEPDLPPLIVDAAGISPASFNAPPPLPSQPSPQDPPFAPSSAGDVDLPVAQVQNPLPLELPGDKLDNPPDLKGVEPQAIPPFVMDSSPVVRLDQTTQQTHWEQDMFADAVAALGDYRDESRRWRANLISILQHINNDLRMDNTILESILRHFELSRRSP